LTSILTLSDDNGDPRTSHGRMSRKPPFYEHFLAAKKGVTNWPPLALLEFDPIQGVSD